MREIGSEFWSTETQKQDIRFFLSGRTALDFIIGDILTEGNISAVHMPSLCCHSMVEPFLRNSIPVVFYDVFFEDGVLKCSIPPLQKTDVFFYIKYFGYENQATGDLARIKNSGCTIIEDTTHSWLMDERKSDKSNFADYSFASFRKWTGLVGVASAEKARGKFSVSQQTVFHQEYETLRKQAQSEKQLYLETMTGSKQSFLDKFAAAEDLLDKDYADYMPALESLSALFCLDKGEIIQKRRKNAEVLLNEISDIPNIVPIFKILGNNDVPLCVPILVDKAKRNDLRKHLISNQIYCPVHWPLSSLHETISERATEIYNAQLSLVCDQRYDVEDMKRMAECIRTFFEV